MHQLTLPGLHGIDNEMLQFPIVPKWWSQGSKFMKLNKGFTFPNHIIGYDTETCQGSAMTQQIVSKGVEKIIWINDDTILDTFLQFIEGNYEGYIICYCFNSTFDLALLLRRFIDKFLQDDFNVKYKGWEINVFCSKNWHATFKREGYFLRFLDIHNYFIGNLDSVSKSFGLDAGKSIKPENLGFSQFGKKDKIFCDYALQDARLCYQMGEHIVNMHKEFDIPISTSSANFAEKVFRRQFIKTGWKINFPNEFGALRLAEIAYHGGKNGYYLEGPRRLRKCYEYDFNAAYGFAMYSLPSFLVGKYQKVSKFSEKYEGVYQVSGKLKSCPFGILYNTHFQYYRFPDTQTVKAFVTSYELREAIASGEFEMQSCKGWIWKPETDENPIRDYAKYFWEKKNNATKGTVNYLFYKLCLNSLYGKWIQRNPRNAGQFSIKGETIQYLPKQDVSGGLYHPFIASLITGFTRARLHSAEHFYDAIESSTDSVKSTRYHKKSEVVHSFGAMQLEKHKCKTCKIDNIKSVDAVFIRNRLNLLMHKDCSTVIKCALHGFWGNGEMLKKLWQERKTEYSIERMPMIREGIKHTGKPLFQMYAEDRSIDIDWSKYAEIK